MSQLFEKYYKEIIPADEWDSFHHSLSRRLPLTFLLNLPTSELNQLFFNSLQTQIRNQPELSEYLFPVQWYPHSHTAWRSSGSAGAVKKKFPEFHEFIGKADACGAVYKQEEVSMIPTCFLDVHPGLCVLDLCASPGSKTRQILRELGEKGVPLPQGVVIANDSSWKRCFMLADIHHPALLVTNHEGQYFPSEISNSEGNFQIRFDRILCDVPCSGDGTLRKLPRWCLMEWSGEKALLVHPLQVALLKRAIELVKPDGRVVYSTCSMNPIENEAVVAEILRTFPKGVALVDVSKEVPTGLRYSPGLSHWPQCPKGNTAKKDVENSDGTPEISVPESTLPPSLKEKKKFHLHHCLRFYPHQQDTGGFFVAVFEKKHKNEIIPTPLPKHTKKEKRRNKKHFSEFGNLVPLPESIFSAIKKVYSFSGEFPEEQLHVRKNEIFDKKGNSVDCVRKVFLLSKGASNFIRLGSPQLKVVAGGICAYERYNKRFDVMYNFMPTLELRPFILVNAPSPRVVNLCKKDFSILTTTGRLFYSQVSQEGEPNLTWKLNKLFTGYVLVGCRMVKELGGAIWVICKNGQGSLTLCGKSLDVWFTKTISQLEDQHTSGVDYITKPIH